MIRPHKPPINEVYLDKQGVIHTVYHGQQTAETLESTHERTMKIIIKLLQKDKPVWVLADIQDIGQYDMPARFVEMHARTVLPFWRMAIVSSEAHPEGEVVSRKITAMSGRKGEIRYFRREDDAIGWLLSTEREGGRIAPIKKPSKWAA